MRILAVVDSVGLPRPWAGVNYEDSYIGKLESEGSVWVISNASKTIDEAYGQLQNIAGYLPEKLFDIGIIHLGLVDCAPRPIPYELRKVLSLLTTRILNPI